MSVLSSKRKYLEFDRKFSKELYNEVNKDLKIFTDEEWDSIEDSHDYKKVLIAVYIRTDKDNLVLMLENNKFSNVSNVPPLVTSGGIYPSILLDAGLVCGKSLVDSVFSFKSEDAMRKLVTHSTCYPVGAVETSKKYAVVFSVVVSEDLLRDPDIMLNKGFHFRPIETLTEFSDALQRDISESLVIVKSEVK